MASTLLTSRLPQRHFISRVLLLLGGLASSAYSGEISNPVSTSNLSSPRINGCAPPRLFQYDDAIQSSDPCGFTSEFRQILGIDRRAGFGTDPGPISVNSVHQVIFDVIADPGEAWDIVVAHERVGSLLVRNDGGKCGRAELSGITASSLGVTGGSALSTSTTYAICNCNNCSNNCESGDDCSGSQGSNYSAPVFDTRQATLSGVGPTAVTLTFSWSSEVETFAAFPNGGDEAIVRLGISAAEDPNWNAHCGDIIDGAYYPTGSDGHRVTVRFLESQPDVQILEATCTRDLLCGPDAPCTYVTRGIVSCLGNNYTVLLDYKDQDGMVIQSVSLVITDGNREWSSSIQAPCGAWSVDWTVIDNPGVVGGGGTASGTVSLVQLNPCGGSVPLLPGQTSALFFLLLLACGVLVLRKSGMLQGALARTQV